MTSKESRKSEKFKMTFPAKIVGEPIMTKLSHDFGVSYNGPIPGATGGVVVSEKVAITIEIEGVLSKPE